MRQRRSCPFCITRMKSCGAKRHTRCPASPQIHQEVIQVLRAVIEQEMASEEYGKMNIIMTTMEQQGALALPFVFELQHAAERPSFLTLLGLSTAIAGEPCALESTCRGWVSIARNSGSDPGKTCWAPLASRHAEAVHDVGESGCRTPPSCPRRSAVAGPFDLAWI